MPNFEVLDARIASALNKIIHNSQFKRRVSLEEQKTQKQDRFLRGRQIAYLIYEYFRVTGTHDSVENYTDLFTIVLRNDDIQEFDSKWDGILLSMTKIPPDEILEGLYKLRIRESEKLKTVLELYDLETHQKNMGPDYHRLKTMVKRSIEQDIRNNSYTLYLHSLCGKYDSRAKRLHVLIFPSEAVTWIKEEEMVDSLDELKSSRSIAGKNFPNFEMLDARIASALNKIIQNSQFKKKVSPEEQKALKEDRFLRGRQIAFMICDYFRLAGAHDTALDYDDFSLSLYAMTTFRNSIQDGTWFYCRCQKFHQIISWKVCTN